FGPRALAHRPADEMELRFEPMGLKVELVTRYSADDFTVQLPSDAPVSSALSLAAAKLAGRKSPFEFLLPRVTAWQQIATRYSSGKLRTASAAAAVVLLIAGGMFLFQQWQLMRWDSQWKAVAPKVRELEGVQQ